MRCAGSRRHLFQCFVTATAPTNQINPSLIFPLPKKKLLKNEKKKKKTELLNVFFALTAGVFGEENMVHGVFFFF